MRAILILSTLAISAALPAAAAAQDFGDLLNGIADRIAEKIPDNTPDAPSIPTSGRSASSGELSNRWQSASRSRFRHVLEGAPGRYRLTIRATTTSPGGETVAVYPQTSGGERGSPRIGFVIATTQGNTEEMFVTIPQPPEGETQGSLAIVVDVENASGREYTGDYALALEPVG